MSELRHRRIVQRGPGSEGNRAELLMTATVTDEQIRALRHEQGCAGDTAQVAICDRALDGDDTARAECADVIAYRRRAGGNE